MGVLGGVKGGAHHDEGDGDEDPVLRTGLWSVGTTIKGMGERTRMDGSR